MFRRESQTLDSVAGPGHLLHKRSSRRAFLGQSLALGATGATAGSLAPAALPALAAPTPTAAKGGSITIQLTEPDSLFSGAISSATGGNIMRFIANGLVKLDLPSMKPVPDLAPEWQVSKDGKTYTFALHDGVKWQDGQPFSVDDVLFSYGLWAHPKWPGPLDPNLAIIAGANDYKNGKAAKISGIEAVDANTVRFTLTAQVASFLTVAATYQLLPQHVLKDVSPADAAKNPFAQKPIYTGPFMVESWQQGQGLTFTAFRDCFAGPPNLDKIVTRTIPDPATAVADLQSGGLNLAFVSPDQYETFKNNNSYQTRELAGAGGWFLEFDLTRPMFSDSRVRQAIGLAIDRATIVKTIFLGRAQLNNGIASPLSWIYDSTVPTAGYDVNKAKALLDEAGWKIGADSTRAKDGQALKFKLNVTSNTSTWALAIQPYLQAVGIHFEVNQLEFGTWIEQQTVGKHEASLGGWYNFIIDPRQDLESQFESPRTPDATGYNNPQVNQLFQQARVTLDQAAEKKFYDKIQETTASDNVYAYLWRPQDLMIIAGNYVLPQVQIQSELYARAAEWGKRA